jgi:hypothetical protein
MPLGAKQRNRGFANQPNVTTFQSSLPTLEWLLVLCATDINADTKLDRSDYQQGLAYRRFERCNSTIDRLDWTLS